MMYPIRVGMEANKATELGYDSNGVYNECVRCGDEFLTHNTDQTCCADCSTWRHSVDVSL
jgi:hypothetical protein